MGRRRLGPTPSEVIVFGTGKNPMGPVDECRRTELLTDFRRSYNSNGDRPMSVAPALPSCVATEEAIRTRWLASCETSTRLSSFFKPLCFEDRLSRLFAVACCREVWHLIVDARSRSAVEASEAFADGKITREALNAAAYTSAYTAAYAAAAADAATAHAATAAAHAATAAAHAATAQKEMWTIQSGFLVLMVDPETRYSSEWNTDTAKSIARGIYEGRDFSAMSILADAIQDAGCDQERLLERMRNPDTRWCKGCRVLDEILGLRS